MNATDDPGAAGVEAAEVQDAWTLAVDLGCAQLAAVVTDGTGAQQALEFDGAPAMPSGVWLDSDGLFVIGTAATRQALLAPQRWEPAPVRMLGEAREHQLGGAPFEPRDAVAQVLAHVLQVAREHLGRPPEHTVLICPQPWADDRREALTEAGRRAGMNGVIVLGAAQAAGQYLYATGLLVPGGTVAVMDVGAGSVSTAVIRRDGDTLEILGSEWCDGLGGNSFDQAIFRRVVRSVLSLHDPRLELPLLDPPDARWRRLRESLLREVRRAREELTRHGIVRVHTDAVADASLELNRNDLDVLIRPQIDQMVTQVQATLMAAGVAAQSLDGVALLGGTGATPLLARAIVASVGQVPRLVPDPLLALAFGGVTTVPTVVRHTVPAGHPPAAPGPLPGFGPGSGLGPVSLRGPGPGPGAGPGAGPGPRAGADHGPVANQRRTSDESPAGGLRAIPPFVPTPKPVQPEPPEQEPAQPELAELAEQEPAQPELAEPEPAQRELAEQELAEQEQEQEPEQSEPEPAAESELPVETEPAADPTAAGAPDPDLPVPGVFVVPDPETLVPSYVAKRLSAQPVQPQARVPEARSLVPSWVIIILAALAAVLAVSGASSIRPAGTVSGPQPLSPVLFGQSPSSRPVPSVTSSATGSRPASTNSTGSNASGGRWAAWGDAAELAHTWSAVVPVSPGATGSRGQQCKAVPADSPFSTQKILCTFPNDVRLTLLSYATAADRDRRAQQLAAARGVDQTTLQVTDLEGHALTGTLYSQDDEVWRWWALDGPGSGERRSAVYTRWPGHTAAALKAWWGTLVPFT